MAQVMYASPAGTVHGDSPAREIVTRCQTSVQNEATWISLKRRRGCPTLIAGKADSKLFRAICGKPQHVLTNLLPPTQRHWILPKELHVGRMVMRSLKKMKIAL